MYNECLKCLGFDNSSESEVISFEKEPSRHDSLAQAILQADEGRFLVFSLRPVRFLLFNLEDGVFGMLRTVLLILGEA